MLDKNDVHSLIAQDVRVTRVGAGMRDDFTDRQRQEAVKAIFAYMKEFGLSEKDVATGSKVCSATTLNEVLSMDPATMKHERRDPYLRDLLVWVDREKRSRESRGPEEGFCYAKPAKRINGLVERLGERSDNFVGYASGGIGKSMGARAVAAGNPSVIYVLCTWDTRHPSGLLKAIFAAASRRRRKGGRVTLADVAEVVRTPERVSTRIVLILDQADVLTLDAVWCTMHLQEISGCSILFLGTKELVNRLSDDDDPTRGQISSRIGLRTDLAPEVSQRGGGGRRALGPKLFTIDEIRRIFRADKLRLHPDAARELLDISNDSVGHLRRAARIFSWAVGLARNARRSEILLSDIREALAWVTDDDAELAPSTVESTGDADAEAAAG